MGFVGNKVRAKLRGGLLACDPDLVGLPHRPPLSSETSTRHHYTRVCLQLHVGGWALSGWEMPRKTGRCVAHKPRLPPTTRSCSANSPGSSLVGLEK